IVYNVPKQQAIDIINGNQYQFVGDSILLEEGALQNFHLKPGRIAQQLNVATRVLDGIFQQDMFYQFNNRKILMLDRTMDMEPLEEKIKLDLVIISKDPKLSIAALVKLFNCTQFVFDGSNPAWKIRKWQQECRLQHLNYHSIPEAGAFIYNVGI
ncbi:MAG: hypothetical protein ABIN74_07370, partial [Ferruginibacter sp.]